MHGWIWMNHAYRVFVHARVRAHSLSKLVSEPLYVHVYIFSQLFPPPGSWFIYFKYNMAATTAIVLSVPGWVWHTPLGSHQVIVLNHAHVGWGPLEQNPIPLLLPDYLDVFIYMAKQRGIFI